MTYEEIQTLIDDNLPDGQKIHSVKHREVEHALLDYIQANLSQSGDVKRIKCDLTYLEANFESDGLGKNLRLGWAICNGNNGTDNLAGRVGVGYGVGYSTLSSTGGSPDAVVVEHSHGTSLPYDGAGTLNIQSLVNSANSDEGWASGQATTTVGVSGTGKNMQPYIVQLYIMKL